MAESKKKALYLGTESTFGTAPAGATFLQVFAKGGGLSFLTDGKDALETEYFTGRNFPTAPIAGPDGGSFDFEIPLTGLATAAGDNVNASTITDDYQDRIWTHVFGQQVTTIGEGAAPGSTTSSLVLDADSYNIGDVVPVFEANLPSAGAVRSQWAYLTTDSGAGTYTVSPLMAAAPTAAAFTYGQKRYLPTDEGGSTLAFHYVEDELAYTLTGCRIKSATIMVPARKICTAKFTVEYDAVATGALGGVPAIAAAPAVTPLRGILSPFYFNGVQYATPMVTIDLGLQTAIGEATEGVNGRGDHVNVAMVPKVSVQPLRTDAIRELKRQVTPGRMVVQIGAGIFAGGIFNGMCFAMESAVALKADSTDDKGRIRNAVDFRVNDTVTLGATSARPVQLNRA